MYTPWILEREKALRITGPKGIKRMVNAIAAAWADDLELRTHSAEPVHKSGYKPVISEFGGDGVVYRDKNVTVAAFRVPHTAWKEAYGYIFQAADRKIVISGDCTPNDAIVRACNECDVLVHEVYSAEKLRTRPPEWQVYHRQAHTSTVDLARIASEAKPKLLLLYHQLYWGATDEDLVKEVKRGYNGEVKSARDLEVY
jgi:ribonuclease BN (tRNA processing enzyme)